MAEPGGAENRDSCDGLDRGESLTAYCFGEIAEEERDRFEAHLLDCNFCWQEVQRLDAIVGAVRSDKTLTRYHFVSDIVGTVGMSSGFSRFLAGHQLHAFVSASISGSIVALSVLMEIAFEYFRFAALAWTASPLVFLWFVVTVLGGLWIDVRITRMGRAWGLVGSVCAVVAAAGLHYVILRPFLPSYPVTQAGFQTWTAQAAYLKGVVYCIAFVAVFVLTPFHFVITMQRELKFGRHQIAFELLTGAKSGIAPRGAPYIPSFLLGGLLLAGAAYSLVSTAHLLEALKVTEYTNLFIHTIQLRWLLFLALGLEGLFWYYSTLNELKRECAGIYRLQSLRHG